MVNRNRRRNLRISLAASSLIVTVASAAPDGATASVTFGVYVPAIVRWLDSTGNAGTFVVYRGDSSATEATRVFRLALNVDVLLTAEVTPFENVEDPSDTLETEWKISDDSNGSGRLSGALASDAAPAVGYRCFVTGRDFLRRGVLVSHQPGDGNTQFEVTARVSKSSNTAALKTPTRPAQYVASVVLTALPQPAGLYERRSR